MVAARDFLWNDEDEIYRLVVPAANGQRCGANNARSCLQEKDI
jgi:hypothetical protein